MFRSPSTGRAAKGSLIVSHLARMLVGPEHTRLLPMAAFFGGIYLLGMDDVARNLIEQEIRIGL
jgi:iron complex transport system permease protein